MNDIQAQVQCSLIEDIGSGDISAQLIPESQQATAEVIAREPAVVCGIDWVNAVYAALTPSVTLQWQVKEGQTVQPNQPWLTLSGSARTIVVGERCALNWLQTLSGTATIVAQYVQALSGTAVTLLDTRKTIPGLRLAQKHAVKIGGGRNHRLGLYDAYLIKENHIASCGSIATAIAKARQQAPTVPVEVEVETLKQLQQALDANADIIMLDNFTIEQMHQAVRINAGRAKLEVSGNVNLNTLTEIANTGIDYISVGALTKHLRAVDLSMRVYAINTSR